MVITRTAKVKIEIKKNQWLNECFIIIEKGQLTWCRHLQLTGIDRLNVYGRLKRP